LSHATVLVFREYADAADVDRWFERTSSALELVRERLGDSTSFILRNVVMNVVVVQKVLEKASERRGRSLVVVVPPFVLGVFDDAVEFNRES
jgi:hypothetical protein